MKWTAATVAAVYVVLVLQDFAHYIDHYPYLSFDDSLSITMNTIATTGRFGDVSYPLANPYDVPRHDRFFVYGPWYFYLGAALIWGFGLSVQILRWIHPVVLIFAAALAWWWFGRSRGLVAAATFAVGIFFCLDTVQWPMVRPDVMVSLFASGFLVAAGIAMRRSSPGAWMLAGLCAGCAVFSHMAAVSLLLSCATVFVVWAWSHRADRPKVLIAVACVSSGALASALMFYGSFGFRIGEHLELILAYRQMTSARLEGQVTLGFASVFGQHLGNSFGYLPAFTQGVIAMGVVAGVLAVLLSHRLDHQQRATAQAYVLPPLVSLALYHLSLGFYTNFHSGYTILSQLLGCWLVAATIHVVTRLGPQRWPKGAQFVHAAAGIAVVVVAGALSMQKVEAVSDRAAVAARWVSIDEYIEHLVGPLPRHFYAWGGTTYVLEQPNRAEAIALDIATKIARTKPPGDRLGLAPEYMIMSWVENRFNLMPKRKSENQFEEMATLFPGEGFNVSRLVAADPYGVSRIYQRADAARLDDAWPGVSAWEPATGQWLDQLAPSIETKWTAGESVCHTFDYYNATVERCAAAASRAELPAGWYLVRARVQTGPGAADRMVMVVAKPRDTEILGDLPPDGDRAFYSNRDPHVDLLYRHVGGPLYVALFDRSEGAALASLEVRPLVPLKDFASDRDRAVMTPTAAVAGWTPDAANGVRATATADGLRVEGNASAGGYQLVSPPIAVTPGAGVALAVDFTAESGEVCVGVLNHDQSTWLMPPAPAAPVYRFQSNASSSVHVVLANCRAAGAPELASRFVIRGARIGSRSRYFVDRLMDGWVRKYPGQPRDP